MPSKHLRSRVPASVTGGGGTTTIEAFTDSFYLTINFAESNSALSDSDSYVINITQAETNDVLSEAVQLALSYADSNADLSESRNFTLRVWLFGSSGGTNPANADGANNGVSATVQTAALGATTVTMTSSVGGNVPSVTIDSVIYRGWFSSANTLVTSTGSVIMHSSSALFSDITMFSNSGLGSTVNHLSGTFTFDLLAAGVNTLAKVQSCQALHRTTDAVAGVTPHVLTVDAGCIEISGAFT